MPRRPARLHCMEGTAVALPSARALVPYAALQLSCVGRKQQDFVEQALAHSCRAPGL